MSLVSALYILNLTLLLIHEIESAYEKEWEILKLPGRITGFLIIHIPVIIFLLHGMIEISSSTEYGLICGVITGFLGFLPFAVHKILVKRKDKFNRMFSNAVIISNVFTGGLLIILSLRSF